jgi:hypothetical protein
MTMIGETGRLMKRNSLVGMGAAQSTGWHRCEKRFSAPPALERS